MEGSSKLKHRPTIPISLAWGDKFLYSNTYDAFFVDSNWLKDIYPDYAIFRKAPENWL